MEEQNKLVGLPEEYIVSIENGDVQKVNDVVDYFYKDLIEPYRQTWKIIICKKGLSDIGRRQLHIPSYYNHLPVFTYEQWNKLKEIKNVNNMKVEAPKTFAIKSDSMHLLKACYEEILALGYTKARNDINEVNNFFATNMSKVSEDTKLEHFKQLFVNGSIIDLTDDVIFTLPQDYNKAIEHAKEAINSPYWLQSKVKKMKFGVLEVEVTPGKDYVHIAEGIIYKSDLKKVIDFFDKENRPKLLGYPLEIKVPDHDIKFGCKSGKISELKAIYEAM
jgi:hypothetical protein